MSYTAKRPQLVMKDNNTSGKDPCALCGRWEEAPVGPAIFVEGTWNIVCYDCALDIAPQLVELHCMWVRAEARRFHAQGNIPNLLDGENPFTLEPPPDIRDAMSKGDDLDLDVWGVL